MFTESEVELICFMPEDPDLGVVNAARVSYGGRKKTLDEKDIKLINYLAEHHHTSPFRHPQYTFRIKAPEMCARQLYKHIVGCHYTSQQSFTGEAWNEISGRYVELQEEFWLPDGWRGQSKDNKQVGNVALTNERQQAIEIEYMDAVKASYDSYKELIRLGACREQARALLPVGFFTEWVFTASLQACIHLVQLRTHEGAQKETKEIADIMGEHLKTTAPYSYAALMKGH